MTATFRPTAALWDDDRAAYRARDRRARLAARRALACECCGTTAPANHVGWHDGYRLCEDARACAYRAVDQTTV